MKTLIVTLFAFFGAWIFFSGFNMLRTSTLTIAEQPVTYSFMLAVGVAVLAVSRNGK